MKTMARATAPAMLMVSDQLVVAVNECVLSFCMDSTSVKSSLSADQTAVSQSEAHLSVLLYYPLRAETTSDSRAF
jgi:hypothetical protein